MAEKLRSPVTGMVARLTAGPAAYLKAEATVLMLESMKMEIPLTMPRAGRLARLLVKEGDQVIEGQALAEYE